MATNQSPHDNSTALSVGAAILGLFADVRQHYHTTAAQAHSLGYCARRRRLARERAVLTSALRLVFALAERDAEAQA